MTRRVRTLFASAAIAVVAALGVSVIGAAPASADLLPVAAVGGLDTATVEYTEYSYSTPSTLPSINLSGWAGDLNHPNVNGITGDGQFNGMAFIQMSWRLADG